MQLLFLFIITVFVSCSHGSTNDNATTTVKGRLYAKASNATYTYGTHTIVVSYYTSYTVESTSINLDSYVGDSVQVVMKDMGIRQNPGPELYNVIQITPQ